MRILPVQPTPPGSLPILKASTLLCGLLLLTGLLGCGEQAQIEVYEVPKTASDGAALQATKPDGPTEPARMLAAMIPKGNKTWFFKLMGPDKPVQAQAENVIRLVTSIKFSNSGDPEWELPEGWTQEGSDGRMRFATFRIPGEGESLEMSVMSLPNLEDDYEKYTLDNINRWRDQLSLAPIAKDQLVQQLVRVPTEDDSTALMVNLAGVRSLNAGGMDAPFAPFAGGQAKRPPRQQPAAPSLPSHDVPEGWVKVPNKSIELETFEVKEGGKNAAVTTTRMGPLPDELLLANINRWRKQVDLKPIEQGQVNAAFKDIKAGNLSGRYLKLDGQENAMLVAIFSEGASTWYFKMLGDTSLVLDQEAQFKKFIQSVRFSPNEEAGDE